MHAAAINLRGGVSPRNTRLRGQGAIEYVLVIAIIVLLVMIAGPWVSSAIRNQFNTVAGVLVNGTAGGTWEPSGSGSGNGADSATVQAAIAKDAKDWTLDEQKAVAEDIAAKGEASPAYAKAKAAMDAGTKWSIKLTNGETLEYRIIGINHDNLADGSGKAGLTFLTTSTGIKSRMNSANNNVGGWEASELRAKMNSGEIWNLMPSDFQSKVKSAEKLTINTIGPGKPSAVTATSDRLFLLSYSEIVPTSYWADSDPLTSSEGTQYAAFKGKVMNNHSGNECLKFGGFWCERSPQPLSFSFFHGVDFWGDPSGSGDPAGLYYVFPAWCF